MTNVLCLSVLAAEGAANPFAGTIYQAVAAAVVFIVVLVVLKKAAWSKILLGLQDRENRIREDLETADRSAKQAQQTLSEYEQKLAAANDEVRQIIDQGRSDAAKLATQIKDDAQTQITQMRRRAETEIDAAKQQAVDEIYAQTAMLATEVAGRILKRQIDPQDQQQLVQETISELSQSRN